MRKKWNQLLFVYLLIISLIVTLGMNVRPLHEPKQLSVPVAHAALPGMLPLANSLQPVPQTEPVVAPTSEPAAGDGIADSELKPAASTDAGSEAEPDAHTVVQPPVQIHEQKETAKEPPIHTYEVTAYYLNVRTEPNPESKIIKVVEMGTRLEVKSQTAGGWLELQGEGYVNGKYAEKKEKGEVQTLAYSASRSNPAVQRAAAPVPQVKNIVPKPEVSAPSEPSEPSSVVASDSGLTEEHIARMFEGTELAGHDLEQAILEIEDEYGINAYFTIAVMKLESGNGKSTIAKKKNNLFGLNAIDGDKYNKAFSFETKADSVRRFGQLIAKHYVGKGLKTIEKVAKKYCPANSKWSGLVKNIMKRDYNKL
ncbi:glucosaminidase domain-containing protein [Paenibacillus arenilitoris]|uniref:Glucosaminidase domain-containing protein n=1 Tax=Paenibacillus arenilitoris TaxID=2772299 RepID=A0A927H6F1_9BACL|nr:glucosaminidase domain-containing protein [Paenibacillus arenilitoris]MBD2869915.1 glucosaminidase domain-containing protein [Paenibacillus arenilitoris]